MRLTAIYKTIMLSSTIFLLGILFEIISKYGHGMFFILFEKYLVPDGQIEYIGSFYFCIALIFIWLIAISFGLIKNFKTIRDLPGINSKIIHLAFIAIILLYGICLYLGIDVLHQEDGFMEYMTAIFFLLAFIIYFYGALIANQKRNYNRMAMFTIYFISISLFFIAMEEVSWGQRIFGWETPLVMKHLNVQNEMTFHNISSIPTLLTLVQLVAITLLTLVLVYRQNLHRWFVKIDFDELVPSQEYIYFSILLMLLSFLLTTRHEELLEELISLFFIGNSINFVRLIKSKSPSSMLKRNVQ